MPFPQINSRQSFPSLEQEILAYWKANNTFQKSLEIRKDAPEFNFYDGPPFATGTPHYGHLLAGTIKDVIPRYQTMQGKFVERRFGWDCHGLPIENIVEKKMGISGKKDIEDKIGVFAFNEECRANVFQYTDVWRQTVERMGRWVDMDNDYKTMDTDFMESVWWVFKSIYDKGYVYESYRVVPYCPRCSTPLSNFEVNQGYEDKQDKAVTVKFRIKMRESTGVIIKNEKNEILLGNHKERWMWCLPGWKLEAGEDSLIWALRELEEETWISNIELKRIGTGTTLNNGTFWRENNFVWEITSNSWLVSGPIDKFTEWKFFDLDKLPENLANFSQKTISLYRNWGTDEGEKYILAWTTTPWTLPANLGLAVGADLIYAEILDKTTGETYVLAKDRIATYYKNPEDYQIVREFLGSEFVGVKYEPMFDDAVTLAEAGTLSEDMDLGENAYKVVPGHHVTTDSGTGVVHIAPAYGVDDAEIGQKEKLGFISHIDAIGHTTGLLSDNDVYVFDFNQIVIDRLKAEKKLIHIGTIDHSYPHCYRCHTPLIYRAISAWYVNVESLKDRMIANNQKVNWTPDNIKDGRFGKWLENARDWNISRNRYWGSAIPVWKSEDGDIIVIGSIKELYEANREFGDIVETNGKYTFKDGREIDIHKHFVDTIKLSKDGKTYTRIPEVLDCWFESGSMPYASKHYLWEGTENFKFPADFIAEGLDQTRGWFYTLLILGTALFDNTPFLNVIVNGLILAEDGKKMSKSLKNYPDPMELIDRHGADALRFYMLSSPVVKADDLRFSEMWVEEVVKKVLLPLWNTYSFFTTYANIDAFEPKKGSVTFLRHGETDANKNGQLCDGNNDIPLNTQWKDQAKKRGQEFVKNNQLFDIIITSPLGRAHETASIIAKEIGYVDKLIVDEDFMEKFGGKYSGMFHADIVDAHKKATGEVIPVNESWRIWSHNEVETTDMFTRRIETAYRELLEKYEGKNILIVSHGGVYRALNRFIFNLDYEEAHYRIRGLQNCETVELLRTPLTNHLDTWIVSRLNRLIATVSGGFESYDLQIPTRAITEFMDDLTNWYIRRSRRRFWKSENDTDKMGAYETLYHVLVTLTKVMAPITPMISEAVYRGLTNRESVHLERFPEFNVTNIFTNLDTDMSRVRDIITLGLALRGQKKIRVRQPLASTTIGEDLSEYFQEIIREELNVKEVKIEDMSHVAKKICKPNAKLIGPRFWKAVQDVIIQAKSGNFQELADGRIQVGEFVLEAGEYEIAYEPLEGVSLDVMSGTGMVIAMDTVITEELELEGYARDLVRVIQDLRKEAGYEVSDRVRVALQWEKMEKILSLFSEYITSETLSVIDKSLTEGDISREMDVEGMMVNVVVKK